MAIEWPDYLVIAVYFIFVLVVGLIVSTYLILIISLHIHKSTFPYNLSFMFDIKCLVIMEKQTKFNRRIFSSLKRNEFYTGKLLVIANIFLVIGNLINIA